MYIGVSGNNNDHQMGENATRSRMRSTLSSSLSDLKNRSENLTDRGQILPVLQVNSYFY